jgi:hypothetical protein
MDAPQAAVVMELQNHVRAKEYFNRGYLLLSLSRGSTKNPPGVPHEHTHSFFVAGFSFHGHCRIRRRGLADD